MAYFPMYVELSGSRCLVVGGGEVAARKVQVLQEFGARVTAVAPQFIEELESDKALLREYRCFEAADLSDAALVVAATNDEKVNCEISELCRERRIPVNVVDKKEECTFIFPSYIKRGQVTAAVTSGGASPVLTQYLKREIGALMPVWTGELAKALGELRPLIKREVETENKRKAVYQELLLYALEHPERLESAQDAALSSEKKPWQKEIFSRERVWEAIQRQQKKEAQNG